MRFGIGLDFRNPAPWRRPWAEVYERTLELAGLAEELGFDSVWVTEHHFVDDGYLPGVMPVAAALARETKRMRIGTWVLLLPLHHAVRVAEDAATVDILSGGRFELGAGLGYRVEEFAGYGVDRHRRGRIMDEAVTVLLRALSGESFSFAGEFYDVRDVRIVPPPLQERLPVWLGARSLPAARRAARNRCPLMLHGGRDVYDEYATELRRLGEEPERYDVLTSVNWFVTDDPERIWPAVVEQLRHSAVNYGAWFGEAGDLPQDRASPEWTDALLRRVTPFGTPDAVAAAIERAQRRGRITEIVSTVLPPGADFDLAAESMRLFARKVMPRFR